MVLASITLFLNVMLLLLSAGYYDGLHLQFRPFSIRSSPSTATASVAIDSALVESGTRSGFAGTSPEAVYRNLTLSFTKKFSVPFPSYVQVVCSHFLCEIALYICMIIDLCVPCCRSSMKASYP